MENIEFDVTGNELIIRVDLSHRGAVSSTGKTIRVASTEGNVPVEGAEGVIAGINLYVGNRSK